MTTMTLTLLLLQIFIIYMANGYEQNNADFTPIYYPKPIPSDKDFYYYPNFEEYVQKTRGKYPKFSRIPITHFSCTDFPFPGYFADVVTGCQVYHMCAEDDSRSSFLCPNQTIFNQKTLVCDWWYNVDCHMSSQYYHINDFKFSAKYNQGEKNNYINPHFQNDYGNRINKHNSEPNYHVFNNNHHGNEPHPPPQLEYNNQPIHNNMEEDRNYPHQNQFIPERPDFEAVNHHQNRPEIYDSQHANDNFRNSNGPEFLHYGASNQTTSIYNKLKNVSLSKLSFLVRNINNIIRRKEKLRQ